jgi:hypothetical protein
VGRGGERGLTVGDGPPDLRMRWDEGVLMKARGEIALGEALQ